MTADLKGKSPAGIFLIAAISIQMMTTTDSRGASPDLIGEWRKATVKAVDPNTGCHTIHSYFNTCPESPDGRWVLYYRSTTPEAYIGEIVVRERQTGEEKILARDVTVEDAHRAACQQWICNGREVVFHDYRNGEWVVVAVNIATLEERLLARGRQACWGQPKSNMVPLYGPHSNPGEHRDLELLDVETGEIRTVLRVADVVKAYPEAIAARYGDKPVSVFFPILSPDLKKVIFKVASPLGGDFRSKQASLRHFLIAYDLEKGKFLFLDESWGHPAWHPDSTHLINIRSVLIDIADGTVRSPARGHPVFSRNPSQRQSGRRALYHGFKGGAVWRGKGRMGHSGWQHS